MEYQWTRVEKDAHIGWPQSIAGVWCLPEKPFKWKNGEEVLMKIPRSSFLPVGFYGHLLFHHDMAKLFKYGDGVFSMVTGDCIIKRDDKGLIRWRLYISQSGWRITVSR